MELLKPNSLIINKDFKNKFDFNENPLNIKQLYNAESLTHYYHKLKKQFLDLQALKDLNNLTRF